MFPVCSDSATAPAYRSKFGFYIGLLTLLYLIYAVTACSKEEEDLIFFSGTISAEGETYQTLAIPDLGATWLAQNLNVYTDGSSSCYEESTSNCSVYGRLYTLAGANEGCAKLGPGWQVPTLTDWRELGLYFGGFYEPTVTDSSPEDAKKSYDRLIEGGDSHFHVRKGGMYGANREIYFGLGLFASYWTRSSEYGYYSYYSIVKFGRFWSMDAIFKDLGGADPEDRLTCRCIKYE